MKQVYTEKELELALLRKEDRIVFEGPKASAIVSKFEEAEEKRRTRRNVGLGLAALHIVAAPFTGGGSLLGLGAAAGAIALSDAVIIAIITAVTTISVEAIRAMNGYRIHKLDCDKVEFVRKN